MRLIAWCMLLCMFTVPVFSYQPKSFEQQIPKTARLDSNRGWVDLRGIGIYKHFAQDIYAGAFYSQNKEATPEAALQDPGPKRMFFLILHPDPTFDVLIEKRLKLNNAPKMLKKEQVRLSQLFNILDRNFVVGDTITFDYIPEVGTHIMVNNSDQGIIEGKDFYTLLLNMWMGGQPPSNKFREDLFSILNAPTIVN